MATQKKKSTTKKTSKSKTSKHSKDLVLFGESPNYSRFKIKKNQPQPRTVHSTLKRWDHFIAKLDAGDEIEMDSKEAGSFTNRARILGYVIVMRKRADDKFLIWFGGLKK